MSHANRDRIERLYEGQMLSSEELLALLTTPDAEDDALLADRALAVKRRVFGDEIYLRGLIEISNYCKNDCYYCGIRASNRACDRYRLSDEDILACCAEGHALGFRTFVLQGGEDAHFTDARLVELLHAIKARFADCAVTLSLGERSPAGYAALRAAGADRYLLRHETATEQHYRRLHPPAMSFSHRMACLHTLRQLGFAVGCGFMVGSPGQTPELLVRELEFVREFAPEMCGIGPFVPHRDTPFGDRSAGSVELTCRLLALIRLLCPTVLLPATTALGTLHPEGREMGILHGANVLMPNLSPPAVRKKYMLYDNKLSDGAESAQSKEQLLARLDRIGCFVRENRGDPPKLGRENDESASGGLNPFGKRV